MAKVAIVTGSSSGLGKETAVELAGKGYHVVYACRSKDKAEEAMKYAAGKVSGAKTTFIQLDTGKMASVKAFVKAFLEKFDRLDVLVNNAGSGYFLKKDRTTEDGLEAFFQTNYLGPFLLTKLLMDILKKSSGRVVCVTSIEHWEGSYDFEKVSAKTGAQSYATSKLMLMLLAFELCRQGLPACAVNPGGVFSGIWWYLRGWKATLWNMIAPMFLLSSNQGCQTSVHAATADNLPSSGPVYFSPYKQKTWCPYYSDMLGFYNGPTLATTDPRARKEENWQKLWAFSEEKVKPFL